ncbi:MAG: hypothetical protein CMF69_10900 [Magnetovibrio sp.]|nr:hypothetical protein [Magnetovibrio sp.]|tara:strand:- start:1070 stop:2803 length:1734 start_codon:yes stop_codon:yes gene_type:complete
MNRQLRRKTQKRQQKGKRQKADKSLRQALNTLKSGDSKNAFEVAFEVLERTGRDDAAKIAAHAALKLESLEQSIIAYFRLIKHAPTNADIQNDLAGLLCMAERFREAESASQQALTLDPDHSDARVNLGHALVGQKRTVEAEQMFKEMIKKSPDNATGHSGLGIALESQGRLTEAVPPHREAYRLNPANRVYRNNLETILRECGIGLDERERMYRADLINNPEDFSAAMLLACIFRDTERLDSGKAVIESWIPKETDLETKDRAQLREILSELQFLSDDFTNAWPNYHWRLKRWERWSGKPLQPAWNGQSLKGKNLLVFAEQGVGDQVMFMALMPDLIARGARITLECDPRLVPLFQRSFPNIQCVPVEKPAVPETLSSKIDYHVAMGSIGCWLWKKFKTRSTSSYLKPDAEKTAELRAKYKANSHNRLIGVSWESPQGANGAVKSLTLSHLIPLFDLPNTRFIDLQYGDTEDARNSLKKENEIELIHDDSVDQMQNLDDFAAQVAAMDAVVSVSNSTAHIAGALGITTCILLSQAPQWKWGGTKEDCEWYPNVRLLRRSVGESAHNQICRTKALIS